MPILNSINQMQDQMTEWRQDLHKIPEIGLQEFETSKYLSTSYSKYWQLQLAINTSQTPVFKDAARWVS